MTRLKRAAIVTALADALLEAGSWSGETHLQKATYFLQDMLGVPLEFEYVLYKHGPYSFDLHDDLAEMRADEILEVIPQSPPYGPKLESGEGADQLRRRFPKTIDKYDEQITYVAQQLGNMGIFSLERLATAFWVTENEEGTTADRARELHALKPHISVADAKMAIEEVEQMAEKAPAAAA